MQPKGVLWSFKIMFYVMASGGLYYINMNTKLNTWYNYSLLALWFLCIFVLWGFSVHLSSLTCYAQTVAIRGSGPNNWAVTTNHFLLQFATLSLLSPSSSGYGVCVHSRSFSIYLLLLHLKKASKISL